MERGKGTSGRGGKSKTPQYPPDLYALGSKSTGENKQRANLPPNKVVGAQPAGERDRKRDGPSLSSLVPNKKPKITPGILGRPPAAGSSPVAGSSSSSSSDAWELVAVEVETGDFVINVLDAADADDVEKVIGNICGAVKLLKTQRFKPDLILYQSLAYLAKVKKNLFTNDYVVNAFCSLLRKENVYAFKSKGNTNVVTLAVCILNSAFQDIKRWPEIFVKLYLEDAGGERSWVDNELCKSFVENIVAGLNTKPITVSVTDAFTRSDQQEDEVVPILKQLATSEADIISTPTIPRFRNNKDAVEAIVLETVKEQLSRKQSTDLINRNFLKMLTSLCGVTEVRVIVASRLEAWLQNPKLMRPAQELLMSLCVNCTAQTIKDVEVISCLIKMRLKTKALSNYYLLCIKELVSGYPDNLATVLKHTIYNELSSSRNPNNMAMLGVIFQFDPEQSALYLAEIFQELLLNRDDYLRPLRALVREMARVLRAELRLSTFCRGLMSRTEPLPREADNIRAFTSIADLISLAIFLAVMPHARSEKKDQQQMEKMQITIANIQADALWWLQETAIGVYRPNPQDYLHAIQKILLLEPAEQYYKIDTWPPEQDRALFMRLATEVPVREKTIITILAIGIIKEYPLAAADSLEITEQLVKRAASIQNPITPVLKIEKIKVLDLIFNACAYRHPDKIDLPTGYTPPSLAISVLYWRAWTILLVLSAHNPAKLGALTWEKYPTLRVLMEMCITNHFVFAPGFDDLLMLSVEKQSILEFESHLAAASTKMEITEQSSLLLTQLIRLDPTGPPRRPPPAVLDTIRSLNGPLGLGHLLCSSRNPDFLLDIIHRQGASQSMPWLADLVHNSEGALDHLPVQCLCEFLMSTSHKQDGKYQQLLAHLQNILTDAAQDPSTACEVLDYFLRRLSSPNNRNLAITGLKLVISPIQEEEMIDCEKPALNKGDTTWLSNHLPKLPHFEAARSQIVSSLRGACQVENDPDLVTAYLCFLAQYANGDLTEMTDLVIDMAQLIVERSTIMGAILPNSLQPNPALDAFVSIFFNYLSKAREPRKEAYTWSESQDQVLVTWSSGEECTVHILVVHAMVILLTYGPHAVSKLQPFNHLLDTWFPKEKDKAPKGYLVDTSEEALLIPDWLKLRMIRSHVPRLVEAALTDLDVGQLILFIQSFGIPIASMSKLLATLDAAVLIDKEAVGEAVIDKAYMVQLVEVQHRRGAVGGEIFTKVLDLMENPKSQPMEEDESNVEQETKFKILPVKKEYLSLEEGVKAFDTIFISQINRAENMKSLRELFQSLQRTLAFELKQKAEGIRGNQFVKEIVVLFLEKTQTDKVFIQNLFTYTQFSSPLLRLLTTLKPNSSLIAHISTNILREKTEFQTAKSKPLLNIARQYILQYTKGLDEKDIEGFGSVVSKPANEDKLESSDELTDAMQKLLVDPAKMTGHLVDKLVRLEPEILGSSIDLQMRLLFSGTEEGNLQFRPYLLTLLTHHASWSTLHNCVQKLMQLEAVRRYEPTSVLDFLRALTCNPKLWQGREKHTPKHYTPENVLNLTVDQLTCMIDYIVAEAVQLTTNNSSGKLANEKITYQMTLRLQLLTQCVKATDGGTITTLARHVIKKAQDSNGNENQMCNQLLVQLYLKVPSLITQLGHIEMDKLLNKYSSLSVGGSSLVDVLSHTLLTALASSSNAKDWPKKSQDLELSVRKLAATHPLLVLRQLPLISSSLRGRVDLDWGVFKNRNHLLFFQQVSGFLDLLQPSIFHSEYQQSLQKTLDAFVELFQNHGRENIVAVQPIGALIAQFVSFVQGYIKHNAKSAQAYLLTQAQAISELQGEYQVLGSLCVVITGLRGDLEVIVTPNNPVDPPNPQWEDKVNQLSKEVADPVGSLMFLDYGSSKRPGLLGPLLSNLCGFLGSPVLQVRNCAHSMVVRYLRHNPRATPQVLPAFMACLDSPNPDVIASALEKIPEVVVCSQELALPLLQKVFNLGMRCHISTAPCISKTISMLNLQSAC